MSIKRILPDDSVLTNSLQASSNTSLLLDGYINDGSAVVGVIINNLNTLANSSAKIVSFQNNNIEKAFIRQDGAVFAGSGTGSLFAGVIDNSSAAALSIGGTNATSIAIGRSGITTTTTALSPLTTNTYQLGTTSALWSQVNSSFFFVVGGGSLDTSSAAAGTLHIGDNNATGIVIGKNSITTVLASNQINLGPGSGSTALLIVGSTQTTADTAGVNLQIQAAGGGNASATGGGTGGTTIIQGASGGNGTGALNPGAGGGLTLKGHDGATGGTGNSSGGSVLIDGGAKQGTGTSGVVNIGTTNASGITIGKSGLTTVNTGHLSIDGYTINISSGSLSGQGLVYNGTAFVPTTLNAGTVTSIATTSRLTGGTITTTGTLDLATSGVSANSYSNPSITVDAYGRITAATQQTTINASFFNAVAGGGFDSNTASPGGLHLGDLNATSIVIGKTGITTTISGILVVDGYTISPAAASSGQALVYNGSAYVPTSVSGTIGGSIASTQIPVGSGTNTIAGSSALTFSSSKLNLTGDSYVSGRVDGYNGATFNNGTGQILLDSLKVKLSKGISTIILDGGIHTTGNLTSDGDDWFFPNSQAFDYSSNFVFLATDNSSVIYQNDNITTGQNPSISLQNITAATSSTPSQYSPGLELISKVWNGSASLTGKTLIQLQTTNGTTIANNSLHFFADKGDGGGYAEQGSINIGLPGYTSAMSLTSNAGTLGFQALGSPTLAAQMFYGGYSANISPSGFSVQGGAPVDLGTGGVSIESGITINGSGAGTINMGGAGDTFNFGTSTISFNNGLTPLLKQTDNTTSSVTAAAFTIQAANATGTSSTGGNLILTSGTGTTIAGNLILRTGGTNKLVISPNAFIQSGTSFSLTGNAASSLTTSSGNTTIDSAAVVQIGVSTATSVSIGHSGITTTHDGYTAFSGHLIGTGSTPTFAVGSAVQLGTGPSMTINGNDKDGYFNITTGTTPTIFSGSTKITAATITFANAYSAPPKMIMIQPYNDAAALTTLNGSGATLAVAGIEWYIHYPDTTATSFKLSARSDSGTALTAATLPASTLLQFSYLCIG